MIKAVKVQSLRRNITVKANAELTLLSSTLSADQTVCVNSNIEDISNSI